MTDKEAQITDGVIRGILAFLSNPKNEWIYKVIKCNSSLGVRYETLSALMERDTWFNKSGTSFIYSQYYWKQCVDHALMILAEDYNYG